MSSTTRHRATDTRTLSTYQISDYNPGSSTPSSVSSVTNSGRFGHGERKAVDDVPDPTYYKRKKKGEVVLHPFSLSKDVRESVDSSWSFGPHPTWGMRKIVGTAACEVSVPPSGALWTAFHDNIARVRDQALIGAYAKMKSPDALLAVSLHEREKTVQMLRKPFSASLELSKRIFGRKVALMRRGWTASRAAAQAWLEYRFGWRPLVSDISGTVKALTKSLPKRDTILVARSGRELKFEDFYSGSVSWVAGTVVTRRGTWTSKVQASAGVIYTLRDASEAELRAHYLGLDLYSVPSTVWEVIPYSFVVDYYVNVGAWLSAITPSPLFEVLGDWATVKEQQRHQHFIDRAELYVGTPPATLYTQTGGSYVESFDNVTREVGLGPPRSPTKIAIPLSFAQIVDQAALILGGVNSNLRRLRL